MDEKADIFANIIYSSKTEQNKHEEAQSKTPHYQTLENQWQTVNVENSKTKMTQ